MGGVSRMCIHKIVVRDGYRKEAIVVLVRIEGQLVG